MPQPKESPLRKSSRLTLSLLTALAGLLAFAGVASAAVTTSQITSPSSPHFSLFDRNAQTELTVSGETDGEEGDEVEIRCYYEDENESDFVEDGIEVDENGDFSAEVNPERFEETVCNLRAIPQGESPEPEELRDSFGGPLMATSYSETEEIESGPNSGLTTDFYAYDQQLSAAGDYSSMSECGIEDQYLFDSTQTLTAATFFCNDYYYLEADRSKIQVDGEDAYTPTMLANFNDEAPGLPEVQYSYDFDPANGNLTIHEVDPLLACDGGPIPPFEANCPAPESAGVSDHRTIVQDHDGHLITISDEFVSTDGAAHSLDLRPENEQYFAPEGQPTHGEEVAYRFPGESTYSTHAEGDVVNFAATVPSVTYAMRDGAADGDTSTGRGAIILDSAASPATFNNVEEERSGFYYQQSASVPAGGATTLRAAYASAYTEAELATLVGEAEAAFKPAPPVNPIVPPAVPAAPVKPAPASGKFQVGKLKLNKAKGTAILTVNVPGAGTLKLSGKQVKAAKAVLKAAGKAKLKVAPKPALAKKLAGGGSAKVSVKLNFAPVGGAATTQTRKLKLVKNG